MSRDENKRVAKPETWDNVAEKYTVNLEEGDFQLAGDIERILSQNGIRPGDSLIEMGCGSGHLSACLAQKGYKVTLVDFSAVALEKAKQTFREYGLQGEFILADLFKLDETIPVHDCAWNSGVMEHFGDAELIALMKNIERYARKGVLYLVPNTTSIAYLLMRARLMAENRWEYGEEYLRTDYCDILTGIGYKRVCKSFISTAAISAFQIWCAEKQQGNVSELYKALCEEKMLPETEGYLVACFASNCHGEEPKEIYNGNTVQKTRIFDLVAKKIGYIELESEKNSLLNQNEELKKELENVKAQYKTIIREQKTSLQEQEGSWQEQKVLIKKQETRLKEYEDKIGSQKQFISEQSNHLAASKVQLQQLQQQLSMALEVLRQKDEYLVQSQVLCQHYATGKLMKLNHFLFRLKAQYFGGTKEDRKAFRSWMRGRRKHTNKSIGEGAKYNPWMVLNEKLKEGLACELTMQTGVAHNSNFSGADTAGQIPENLDVIHRTPEVRPETRKILQQKYTQYDVIILSVIDYDFRHQRPQHFATRFAENGHRVFYVNANFVRPDSV